ncbi:MmgE/PrpD family protein [Cupriavidus pinatubonensis]|uniref:MmgE/PrpD family protein n=1 Tax=Cupriavidus pinatubonensis TaxID=248026 RepID=UPI00361763DD
MITVPPPVVHKTKRMLLDSVGVAFAARADDTGRMRTDFLERLGGQPEATVLGSRGKIFAPNAALANGELIIFYPWGP